jgi:sugar/nucleoside kinase (ribokinase family)
MKKILTIGGATQDIFIQYKTEMVTLRTSEGDRSFIVLPEGKKVEVNSVSHSTGGGATNSAVSFKRLGFDVSLVVKLAQDQAAEAIIKQLIDENINTQNIIQVKEGGTGVSFIIPSPSGDRTILVNRGVNAIIKKDEFPFQIIQDADQLYITSLSGDSSQLLLPIAQEAKKHNISVATNPGGSQLAAGADILRESLPTIGILILNADEAKQFMLSLVQTSWILSQHIKHKIEEKKRPSLPELLSCHLTYGGICFSLKQYFKEVLNRGPRIVVVTNGAEGVYIAHEDIIYFHPSIKTNIINTVGAGDAFGSCFVASIIQGQSIEQSLLNGIINASSVISYLDAKEGLLTKKELEKRAATISFSSLKKFNL